MAVAANIDAAIGLTQSHTRHAALDVLISLRTQLELWASTFVQFDDEDEDERTVRNWKVPTQHLLVRVPAGLGQQDELNEAMIVVYGGVCAAKYARLAGRITAAQLAQVLADWNTAWSY